MSRGYNLKKGFLFSYDWETATRSLSADEFYLLFWDLLDFQKSSGSIALPIRQDHPNVNVIASLIAPQIIHRITCSRQSTDAVATESGFKSSEDKTSEVDIKVSGMENITAPALSEKEHQDLLSKGLPSWYIDERLDRAAIFAAKHERSVSSVLCEWWKADQTNRATHANKSGSTYDTDDFYKAALKRSLEGTGVSYEQLC